jgi:hypothetical protein
LPKYQPQRGETARLSFNLPADLEEKEVVSAERVSYDSAWKKEGDELEMAQEIKGKGARFSEAIA